MVKIRRQMASQNVINKKTSGGGNKRQYITIHETGNEAYTANAAMHANLQSNLNPRDASWHYQVDSKEIVQSFEDTIRCWAAGDGRNGLGLNSSIHIEICVNSRGEFLGAVSNAIALTKHLMKKYNIPISRVVQHNRWSNKHCPRHIRDNDWGISWNQLISRIENKSVSGNITNVPSNNNSIAVDGYWGPATTRALQKYFKSTVDGVISGQYSNSVTRSIPSVTYGTSGSLVIKRLQSLIGVTQDGYIGPSTVRALQRRLGTTVDGVISSPSLMVKELQRALNRGKL